MWKWVVGGVCLLVVVVGATCWYGMKMLTAGGNSAMVTIAGSPDRVFAALANTDSLSAWMTPTSLPAFTTHGPLQVGDSLRVEGATRGRGPQQQMTWKVIAVVPGHLLVMRANDQQGRAVISRRDSLTAGGDSTILVSTFGSPMMDSLRAAHGDTTARGGMLEQVLVSAMRLSANMDLQRLKAHIEGKALPSGANATGGRAGNLP